MQDKFYVLKHKKHSNTQRAPTSPKGARTRISTPFVNVEDTNNTKNTRKSFERFFCEQIREY